MGSKKGKPSQLMDLFLHVAQQLGSRTDRQVAGLADVSPDSIPNWRSGTVREFKPRTLTAIKDGIAARLRALQQHAEHEKDSVGTGLVPLEIEVSSGPTALQR